VGTATPIRRITSIASWSPEIAWRLLNTEEQELLCRYFVALAREREAQATPPAATGVTPQ
jgi:hypothetical protein